MLSSQLVDPNFLQGSIDQGYSNGLSGPDITTLVYKAPNITSAMYSMAAYMTTSLRKNQDGVQNASLIAPAQAIEGVVLAQKQFVVVQWVWLTLPIILLVLAILFLIAAFIETRRSHVGLWQSSPLTLFFHAQLQPRGEMEQFEWNVESLNTEGAMEKAAESLRAKIPKNARATIEVDKNESSR